MEDFAFDEKKAAQAAAFFVEKAAGEINYMKLIKLLYLTDREALKRWGFPMIGGRYVSMDNGPVTSPIYDAVKHPEIGFPAWNHLFKKAGYDLCLTSKPDFEDLSRADMELLEFIYQRFGEMGEWKLVEYTHENCHEWADPQGTSATIASEEILQKVGKTEEEIKAIGVEMAKLALIDRLLSKA